MAQFFAKVNFIPKYLNKFALKLKSKRYTHLCLPNFIFQEFFCEKIIPGIPSGNAHLPIALVAIQCGHSIYAC
jgi:hypothetical protein